MSTFWCLVRFELENALYVVKSTDVREFANKELNHPDDFSTDRPYNVFWQEGEGSFDGYFSAQIICMAASLEELKQKASANKIRRMPSNYLTLVKDDRHSSSDSKEDNKLTSKLKGISREQAKAARKKRMMETLEECSPPKTARRSSVKQDGKGKKNDEENMDGKKDKEVDGRNKNKVDSRKGEKVDDKIKKKIDNKEEKMDDKIRKKIEDKKDEKMDDKIRKKMEDKKEEKINDKIKKKTDDKKEEEMEIYDYNYDQENNDIDQNADDKDEDNDDQQENETNEILEEKGRIMGGKKLDEVVNCESDSDEDLNATFPEHAVDSDSSDSTSKLMDHLQDVQNKYKHATLEISSLKAGLKISEKSRLELLAENKKLKEKIQELKKSSSGEAKLIAENKQLRGAIQSARDALSTGLETSFDGDDSGHSISSFSTPKALKVPLPTPKVVPRALTFNPKSSKVPESTKQPTLKTSSSKHVDATGLSQKEIIELSDVIKQDITGEKPLECDESGQVSLGSHIKLSLDKWKYIKEQKKNSLFIKKLATCTYGHEGLKSRTVGKSKSKSDSAKQVATPAKVDTFVAALRGRLLADNPSCPNIDAAAAAAKVLLANKMQDEARLKKGT